ncbi:MAG: 30S ribosome-binding factor RbfA [Clostridia bacterium]|nr:30S ribosome-binding factor RbfA [Clostridia bacterium]
MALRNQRVAEQMKKEIAQVLRDELKDPRLEVGLVTVTGVELSNDLRYAKVYVSIYGNENHKVQAMEGLKRAASFVRREIGQRLSLRYTPEITFKLDSSIEHGDHINRLLSRVKAEEQRGHE